MSDIWVNGVVAVRDGNPYIQLSNEKGMIAQLSMSEARQIANDIVVMASRTEADAMIVKFFASKGLPSEAAGCCWLSSATSGMTSTWTRRNVLKGAVRRSNGQQDDLRERRRLAPL